MVSKAIALTLLAMSASHINAYYWHAELTYEGSAPTTIRYTAHPVDVQVPGNDAIVKSMEVPTSETTYGGLDFTEYGYEVLRLGVDAKFEMPYALADTKYGPVFMPCTKMDEIKGQGPSGTITRKVFECSDPTFYGRKGNSAPTTTTAAPVTTTCTAVTVTVTPTNPPQTTTTPPQPTTQPPKTTTKPPKPTPTCLAGYKGKRNGKGPNGACCSHSDDCKDTCVKGKCGVHP